MAAASCANLAEERLATRAPEMDWHCRREKPSEVAKGKRPCWTSQPASPTPPRTLTRAISRAISGIDMCSCGLPAIVRNALVAHLLQESREPRGAPDVVKDWPHLEPDEVCGADLIRAF